MIYLHHRPPTKFSSDSKVPAQTRKHFWTPRMVESWFHSGRSTFLGKVSGKMRYRDGSVGNSEISCFVTMHICHPLSSATPSSKVKCTGCVDILLENFSNNRREPNENPYDDAISFIIFFFPYQYFPRKFNLQDWNNFHYSIINHIYYKLDYYEIIPSPYLVD